jgi:hypothetical protein
MQDRPNGQELVKAVASFLDQEIAPTVSDARLRFRTLIAINVLKIVARELELGNSGLSAEWERLTSLLARSGAPPARDADLAIAIDEQRRQVRDRIRSGDFDEGDRLAAALDYAESAVIAKLRISNPRFLARLGIELQANESTR